MILHALTTAPYRPLLILAASQVVVPRAVLAPPPPRSNTIPLLDQLLEGSPAPSGPPRPTTPLRSPPSPAPGSPRVGFGSSSLSRGGAVVLELTRHVGRLTLFDDLLTRPHVAPILATAAMPALAPQPSGNLQQLPLKVAAIGSSSGGGAKAALAHMFKIPAAGGGGGLGPSDDARRPHSVSFAASLALPPDINDGEEEGGLQLSTVRPLDALGRRLPLPRSLQQSQAQPQASKSTAVAVAVPGVTVVLDGSSLAAEDPSGSLFADVLAAAGLALPAPVTAATASPNTTAAAAADEGGRRGSSSDLRGLASAVSLRVATATAAFVQPGTAAVGAVGHATAHAVGAAVHAVGSAASSMGSAAAAASQLLAGSLRGTAAAAAAGDVRHATPARRATPSSVQHLPGNGGGVATVAGGVRLPPWLAGNPDVVVSPSGSVTIVRREERMARMRASDAPQQLQLLPSERIVAGHSHTTGASSAVSEVTTHHHPAAGAAALRSRDGRRAAGGGSIRGSVSDGPPHPSRRLSAISSEDGVNAAGARTWVGVEVEEEGEDGLGDRPDARPYGSAVSECEEEEDLNHVALPSGDFLSAVDSVQGAALLLGDDDGEGGDEQRGVADGGGTPRPGSADVDERAAAVRAPAHSFGRSSLADPRQYPPVNEADLCAALRACCDEAASRAAAALAATAPAAAHGEAAPLQIPLIGGAADAQLYLRYAALARTAGLAPSVLGSSERGAAAPSAAAATAVPSEKVATRDGHEPPGREGGASQPRRWSNADGRSRVAAAVQHAAAHSGAVAGRGARASAAAAAEAAASAGGRVHILTQPDQVALFRRHIHGHRPPPTSSDLDASARWQGEWGVAHRLLSGPHTGMPCGWLAYPLTASATATAASAHLPLYRRYLDADIALAPVEPVPCLVLHATPPPLPMVATPAS